MHTSIKKVKGTTVYLHSLKKNQRVMYGDGKTFYWLLEDKYEIS